MYLVGVDEEELKPDPKPEGPKTPKGKWENYWYHYKWHTIGALFIVVVLAITIGQMVNRDDPDYTIMLVTENGSARGGGAAVCWRSWRRWAATSTATARWRCRSCL